MPSPALMPSVIEILSLPRERDAVLGWTIVQGQTAATSMDWAVCQTPRTTRYSVNSLPRPPQSGRCHSGVSISDGFKLVYSMISAGPSNIFWPPP